MTFVLVSGAWGYFDHHGDEVRWRLFRFAYLLIAVAIVAPPLIIAGFQLEPGMLTQTGPSPN